MTEHPAHSRRGPEKNESKGVQEFIGQNPKFKIESDLMQSVFSLASAAKKM